MLYNYMVSRKVKGKKFIETKSEKVEVPENIAQSEWKILHAWIKTQALIMNPGWSLGGYCPSAPQSENREDFKNGYLKF